MTIAMIINSDEMEEINGMYIFWRHGYKIASAISCNCESVYVYDPVDGTLMETYGDMNEAIDAVDAMENNNGR